jgi:type IV pilus assembly protein PilC
LAEELEHQRDFQGKVKSAMIYPAIIMIVIVGVVVLVMMFMIPAVADIYREFGGQLPTITQILISISDFMRKFWLILFIAGSGLVVGFKYYIESPTGKKVFDKLTLKVPVFGDLITKIQLAQFTQTLHLLVQSGLPILDALDLVADSLKNVHFANAVKHATQEVEKGSSLALPLSRAEVFPLIVSQMIGVGEETGRLDEVLDKMAEYYNNEVNMITENLTTLMEPVMLVIMGGIIGFIAVAVYTPLFSLANIVE